MFYRASSPLPFYSPSTSLLCFVLKNSIKLLNKVKCPYNVYYTIFFIRFLAKGEIWIYFFNCSWEHCIRLGFKPSILHIISDDLSILGPLQSEIAVSVSQTLDFAFSAETSAGFGSISQPNNLVPRGQPRPHHTSGTLLPAVGQDRLTQRTDLILGGAAGDM